MKHNFDAGSYEEQISKYIKSCPIVEISPTSSLRVNNGYLEQLVLVLTSEKDSCFSQLKEYGFWLRIPSLINGNIMEER